MKGRSSVNSIKAQSPSGCVIDQLLVVNVATRSGSVPLVLGIRHHTAVRLISRVYRAVTAINGTPVPPLWANGAFQALPSPPDVWLYKDFRPAHFLCPVCRRGKRDLMVPDTGGHRCWRCFFDRGVQGPVVAPPVIRYHGHRLELTETSTGIPPTEVQVPDLVVAWHHYFPRSPHDQEHPRWVLAAREFRTFVWEMTGLTPSNEPLWKTVVQPVWEPVMSAWEEGDWDGYQAAIAAGKEELASYQLAGMLSSGVMEMVEGTA